jgi:hypothetical protein
MQDNGPARNRDQATADAGPNAEFLVQLADEGLRCGLAGVALSTRKFPETCVLFAFRPPREQDPTALIAQDARDHLGSRQEHGRSGHAVAQAASFPDSRSSRSKPCNRDRWRREQDVSSSCHGTA